MAQAGLGERPLWQGSQGGQMQGPEQNTKQPACRPANLGQARRQGVGMGKGERGLSRLSAAPVPLLLLCQLHQLPTMAELLGPKGGLLLGGFTFSRPISPLWNHILDSRKQQHLPPQLDHSFAQLRASEDDPARPESKPARQEREDSEHEKRLLSLSSEINYHVFFQSSIARMRPAHC